MSSDKIKMLKRYFCSPKNETDSPIDVLSTTASSRCSRKSNAILFNTVVDKAPSGSIYVPSSTLADKNARFLLQGENFLKRRAKSFNWEYENFQKTRDSLRIKSFAKLEQEVKTKSCTELEFPSWLLDDEPHKSGNTSLVLSKYHLLLPRGLDEMESSYERPYKSKLCVENLCKENTVRQNKLGRQVLDVINELDCKHDNQKKSGSPSAKSKILRSRNYATDTSSSVEKSLQIQDSTETVGDVDNNVLVEDRHFLDYSVIVTQKLAGEKCANYAVLCDSSKITDNGLYTKRYQFNETHHGYDSCENRVCEPSKMIMDIEGKFIGNQQDILSVLEENVSLKKQLAARRVREEELHDQISKLEYDLTNNADESFRLATELMSTRKKMEMLVMVNHQKNEENYSLKRSVTDIRMSKRNLHGDLARMLDERSEIESEKVRKYQEFELERERLENVVEDLRRQISVLRTRRMRVWGKCAQCPAMVSDKTMLVSASSRKQVSSERVKKENLCVREAAQQNLKLKSSEPAKVVKLQGKAHHVTYPSRGETIFALMDFVSTSDGEDYSSSEDESAQSLVKGSPNSGRTWVISTGACYCASVTSSGRKSTGVGEHPS